jgi:hypothetical protein
MTAHVRWPAKNSGAFVFGLNFWFFWFKPKEPKRFLSCILIYFLFPLMEKGNPTGLRKKDQGQTNGSARLSGQRT